MGVKVLYKQLVPSTYHQWQLQAYMNTGEQVHTLVDCNDIVVMNVYDNYHGFGLYSEIIAPSFIPCLGYRHYFSITSPLDFCPVFDYFSQNA